MRSVCRTAIAVMLLIALSVGALANEIHVASGDSIQAAVNAAPNGTTLVIAPGTYKEALVLEKPITLIGSDNPEDPTVLSPPSLLPTVRVQGDADVTIDSLVIEGSNRFVSDAVAVYGTCNAVLRGVEVRSGRGTGINVYSSGEVAISGCVVHSHQNFGILVQTDSARVTGSGNVFRDNGAALGLFAPPLLRSPTAPQTTSQVVCVPTDYPTIQQALDAVPDGGSIEISSGEYRESLIIGKRVTLRKVGNEAVLLDVPKDARWGGSVLATASDVVLEGVDLAAPWIVCDADISAKDARLNTKHEVGLLLRFSAHASLDRVEIRDVRGKGIHLVESSSLEAQELTVSSCHEGIHSDASSDISLSSSTIARCRFYGVGSAGSALLNECNFAGNGVDLTCSGSGTITRCMFEGSKTAINAFAGHTTVSSTVMKDCREAAVLSSGGSLTLNDCVVSGAEGETAVCATQNGCLKMEACTVSGNAGDGVAALWNSQVELIDCTITDNGVAGDLDYAYSGVAVADWGQLRLEGCSIGRNAGDGIQAYAWSESATLNDLSAPGRPAENRLEVVDCDISENGESGIYVVESHAISIHDTRIQSNYQGGVVASELFDGTAELSECRIHDNIDIGVECAGSGSFRMDACWVESNARIGAIISGHLDFHMHKCVIGGNLIGIFLAESPTVELIDCQITGNHGYGLIIYCLECSGGRHLHHRVLDFSGSLTGSGNIIPDPGGLTGNGLDGICPDGWEFLRIDGDRGDPG